MHTHSIRRRRLVDFSIAILLVVTQLFVGAPASAAPSGNVLRQGILTQCHVGFPGFPGYDPATRMIYAPSPRSENISLVRSPCNVTHTIQFSANSTIDPTFAAFDAANRDMYIGAVGEVLLVSGSAVIGRIGGGWFGAAAVPVAYDPAGGVMLAANQGGSNVSVLNGTAVLGSIPVGTAPCAISYDGSTNSILIANRASGNVTVIVNASAPIGSPRLSVVVGGRPGAIVYDPANHLDFVANSVSVYGNGSSNITLIDGRGGIHGSFVVAGPAVSIMYSPASRLIFVSLVHAPHHQSVWEFNNTTPVRSIWLGLSGLVYGLAYDAADRHVYLAGSEGRQWLLLELR